jgi:molybdate transport system substrate-binding protein
MKGLRDLCALLALLAIVSPVNAAELKIFGSRVTKVIVGELAAQFEKTTGFTPVVVADVAAVMKRRIEAGEAFDVAVLNPPVLDALIKSGKIIAETRAVLGRCGIGVAIRAGAPKPDISTVEAFKRTLLKAESVAYPGEGASGIYFASLVDRLGITAAMKSKLRPMPGEYNVEVVARGEVEMVVVVASRISGVPGVERAGLIPQELQTWIGFTAGLGSAAKEPAAARSLIQYFTAPAAAAILRSTGVEPFVE